MKDYIGEIKQIADRGPTYALIVFGAIAALFAAYDKQWGSNTLSTGEFIAVLVFAGLLLLTGGLLQFLGEQETRAAIAAAQQAASEEAAADREKLIKFMEISKQMGAEDADRAQRGYTDTVKALKETSAYGAPGAGNSA